MTPPTSTTLLEQLRHNQGWDRFVATYSPVIRSWCIRQGLQSADIDDVTQVALLKLVKVMPKFTYDKDKKFRGYLATVVQSSISDFFRARGEIPAGGTQAAALMAAVVDDGSLSTSLFEAAKVDPFLVAAFAAARAQVTEITWAAFEATALRGEAAGDVAAGLGVSKASVSQGKYRVKQMIHEYYQAFLTSGEAP